MYNYLQSILSKLKSFKLRKVKENRIFSSKFYFIYYFIGTYVMQSKASLTLGCKVTVTVVEVFGIDI